MLFTRTLDIPGLLNARDLGGYPTRSGRQTRWRSLLRADDLVQLTPEGVETLANLGVHTVVDLRWPGEVAISPHPVPSRLPHVRYYHVSLLTESETQWSEISEGCEKEMWKCLVLEKTRPHLRRVLQTIASAPPGPLLFHCVAGKDRTGLIAALLLALAEVEPEAIAADYAESSARLREAYLERYKEVEPEWILEAVRCPEQGVYNMLSYLERFGGVPGYLREIGLEEEHIERLKARL